MDTQIYTCLTTRNIVLIKSGVALYYIKHNPRLAHNLRWTQNLAQIDNSVWHHKVLNTGTRSEVSNLLLTL